MAVLPKPQFAVHRNDVKHEIPIKCETRRRSNDVFLHLKNIYTGAIRIEKLHGIRNNDYLLELWLTFGSLNWSGFTSANFTVI